MIHDASRRWREGIKGIPFVDANMREIAATGYLSLGLIDSRYMSNRGHQNVICFLAKDLAMNWLLGAEYFESRLADYDACSHYDNRQCSAGVGKEL